MKKAFLLLLFMILFVHILDAQILNQPKSLNYSEVFEVPNTSISDIKKFIIDWVEISSNSSNNIVITNLDEENNRIYMVGTMPSFLIQFWNKNYLYKAFVDFKIMVEIREGRYKISSNDWFHYDPEAGKILSYDENGNANVKNNFGLGMLTNDDNPPIIKLGHFSFRKDKLKKYWDDVREDSEKNIISISKSMHENVSNAIDQNHW